jgi:hypothetical protein
MSKNACNRHKTNSRALALPLIDLIGSRAVSASAIIFLMATEASKNYRRWLFLILAVYLLLTTISTISTPLYRGPDEPAHVIYIRQLAHLHFPILAHKGIGDVKSTETHEAHQPPLYYIVAAGPFRAVEALTGSIDSAEEQQDFYPCF